MGGSIPLPALDIRPTQPNDALGSYTKMVSLGNLLQQRQMQQQQIQGATLENQMRQRQMQSAQAMQDLFPKFVQRDDSGKPTGYDYDGLMTAAGSAEVDPATLEHLQTMRKSAADTAKTQADTQGKTLENQNALLDQSFEHLEGTRGETDPTKRQAKWSAALDWGSKNGADISKLPQQAPDDAGLSAIEAALGMHKQAVADAKAQSDAAKAATDALLNQNKLDIINSWKQNPQQVMSQVDAVVPPSGPNAALNARTKSQVQFAMGNGDVDGAKAAIKQAAEQVGAVEKDVQVAQATQPLKLEQSAAEAQTRMALEGMAKPVYAYNPQTNQKDLMSQTEAIAQGRKVMTPVTGKEVSEDTMLINRLADVRQKIARYEQALSQPVDFVDKDSMAGALGRTNLKSECLERSCPSTAGMRLRRDWTSKAFRRMLVTRSSLTTTHVRLWWAIKGSYLGVGNRATSRCNSRRTRYRALRSLIEISRRARSMPLKRTSALLGRGSRIFQA